MKLIIGKKIKNKIINYKNKINILFFDKKGKINEKEEFEILLKEYEHFYDYIIIDLGQVDNKKYVLEKSDIIILLVEANLLGIKETREILIEVVEKQKNQKDNIKIVFNKYENTSISKNILNEIFTDFEKIGNIKYNKLYNLFINTNGKFLNKKINIEYSKIIKNIISN